MHSLERVIGPQAPPSIVVDPPSRKLMQRQWLSADPKTLLPPLRLRAFVLPLT